MIKTKLTCCIIIVMLFLSCNYKKTNNIILNKSKISKKKDIKKEYSFLENRDSTILIPRFALILPQYIKNDSLRKNLENKIYNISKIIGNSDEEFMEDTSDDTDILGHPDIDYDDFTIWNTDKQKVLIYFKAKRISKEYYFYFLRKQLLLVTEKFKTTDSIFFGNNHIILWKNSSNKFVTNNNVIKGKEKYILRLIKEIKEIENNEIGYIEKYNYTKDSLSSFVIGNLKD